MRNQNFCSIKLWVLLRLAFCHTVQPNQLTVSLLGSRIQRTGAPSWEMRGRKDEREEGAGLPLLVAAPSSTDSAATWAHPNAHTVFWQVCSHGKCMFGRVNRNMYSLQRAVCEHMRNLASEQMPQSLSKSTGHTVAQVFSQTASFKSLCLAVHEQREDTSQCLLDTLPTVFFTVMLPVLFTSSSSVPTINALKQI